MSKWNRNYGKILMALGIAMTVTFSSLWMPIAASAATAVTDGVMIRNDASTEAGIIGSLNEGDEVQILDVLQSGDGYAWYYIQLDNGNTGYVRSDLLKADDSELAEFNIEEQPAEEEAAEETQQEEAPAEEEAAADTAQQAAEEPAADTASGAANTSEAASVEGYDAVKDPNAHFSVKYEEGADGGSWYAYNDDNGSKYNIVDSAATNNAAAASKSSGPWKALAILFLILSIGLLALVFYLVKSIREGRSKTSRRRALEAAAAQNIAEDEEEAEEDEYYFEDDVEEEEESEESNDPENTEEADDDKVQEKQEVKEKAEKKPEDIRTEEASALRAPSSDSTITLEVTEVSEPKEVPTDEIEAAIAAKTAQIEKTISDTPADKAAPMKKDDPDLSVADSENAEAAPDSFEGESEEDSWEEEDSEYLPEEDEYAEEDYEEDYDDEEDEYEEDEEDVRPRSKSRASKSGGIFGFLKKILGTDHPEDKEEDEYYDEYDDEDEEREFDEFKEYPEDVDLLPKEESDDDIEEIEDLPEDSGNEQSSDDRGRLTMQKVMKNVEYKGNNAGFSHTDDIDEFSDTLYDDDDDMEYSFISSTKRK